MKRFFKDHPVISILIIGGIISDLLFGEFRHLLIGIPATIFFLWLFFGINIFSYFKKSDNPDQ